MPLVDNRYAEALVKVAVEKNALDLYQSELAEIAGIYAREAELRAFVLNPKNRVDAKKSVISTVFGGKIQAELLNLLFLLLDKNRISRLQGIHAEYVRIADEKRNILSITIRSAISLEQAQIDSIGEKFRKLYRASSVKTAVEIDTDLIGGVKVAVGDKLYDGSISGKLARLQSLIVTQQ